MKYMAVTSPFLSFVQLLLKVDWEVQEDEMPPAVFAMSQMQSNKAVSSGVVLRIVPGSSVGQIVS
jgi:hypothetical protein